jgi:predicted RNA-binding Zn ribbon-like protein
MAGNSSVGGSKKRRSASPIRPTRADALPDTPEPGGRPPAPGPLRLLQCFVNTQDREAGRDEIPDGAALTAWLRAAGLLDAAPAATRADLALARALRDDLRALFLSHHDGRPPTGAGEGPAQPALVGEPRDGRPPTGEAPAQPAPIAEPRHGRPPTGRALTQLPLIAEPRDGRIRLRPADAGVRGALGRLVAIAAEADPRELERLRACRRDACQWVFYDASRNRSGAWCSMDVCGARTKMAAYRRRARGRVP